jgi:hypothetical protein
MSFAAQGSHPPDLRLGGRARAPRLPAAKGGSTMRNTLVTLSLLGLFELSAPGNAAESFGA